MCEHIKPSAMTTAKGGNFPTLSFLPVTCHSTDPSSSVTVSSSNLSSHTSTVSTLNERSLSLPDTVDTTPAVAQPRLQHLHSTPTGVTSRVSTISQYDEEEDFVTSDVFMAGAVDSVQVNPTDHKRAVDHAHEEANGRQPESEATARNKDSLNNDQHPLTDVESSLNEEAAYFVLEKPSKLTTNSVNMSSRTADKDKVSTPAYEEIDETAVEAVKRPHSPLPYEIPSVSRQESCDAYYSNIGSPESSGYTLLSQWTRSRPEEDYTHLDPSTIISKTDGDDKSTKNLYSQLTCSVHLGNKEVLEPLSEEVCLSIKEIVREIHLYLGKS